MDWSIPLLHSTDIFKSTVEALSDATVAAPLIKTGMFHSNPNFPINNSNLQSSVLHAHQNVLLRLWTPNGRRRLLDKTWLHQWRRPGLCFRSTTCSIIGPFFKQLHR
ncbi:hypothetical protein CEXT_87981 [Caerostris extrusa]|uniref:Uncharacterized protein n=1 Tax=Caerostris extrusa TaxID=172846 RepID=A0AAV4P5G8_CAEEX|nr:hypothetical protein CEXT_87981 [Caerostris extrusa]